MLGKVLCHAVAVALLFPLSALAQIEPADMVLLGARIYTENTAHTVVQSLAVRDGRIVFVGADTDAKRLINPHTQVVRANGRLVLPGLVDAHLHPTGIVDFDTCSLLAKTLTLAQVAAAVHGCVGSLHIAPGDWVYVSEWEYGAGNDPDPEHPNLRRALDVAAPHNPVFMVGWDGHHAAYNSAGLALAKNPGGKTVGFTKETIAKYFGAYAGYIGVDAFGEPAGNVNDQAREFIDTSVISKRHFAKLLREPERITEFLNSRGITAALDARGTPEAYELYDALFAKGRMTVHLNIAQWRLPEKYTDASGRVDYERVFAEADSIRDRYSNNPLVRADAIKVYADGVTEGNPNTTPPTLGDSPRPVPYLQPIFARDGAGHLTVTGYVDGASPICAYARAKPQEFESSQQVADFIRLYGFHPGQCAINYGVPEHEPAIFDEYIKQAHLRGYTLHIHAISDSAVTMAIDAIEAARAADGNATRPDTIAHLEFATAADLARAGKDHLFLACTYSWAYTDPTGYDMSLVPFYDHVVGNSYEAMHKPDSYFEQNYYPFKTALKAGAILTAGSDAPVLTKDPQPFVNMEFAMTRSKRGGLPTSPWQRLTIREVLDAYTINGAKQLARESEIGSIEIGKSADFIMIDQDIIALADAGQLERVGDTKVLQTWFQGKKVFGNSL